MLRLLILPARVRRACSIAAAIAIAACAAPAPDANAQPGFGVSGTDESWTPAPADSAAFGRIRRTLDSGGPDRKGFAVAESLATLLERALAARTPVDSMAFANALLLEEEAIVRQRGPRDPRVMPALEQALGIAERRLGPTHPAIVPFVSRIAGIQRDIGRRDLASVTFARVLELREHATPPDSGRVAAALSQLANVEVFAGDYAAARTHVDRAIAMYERMGGANARPLATVLNTQGNLEAYLGHYPQAIAAYERCLALREAADGPRNATVAVALHNIASMYSVLGSDARALPYAERAVAIWSLPENERRPEIGTGLGLLAKLRSNAGDFAGARPMYERSLRIREAAYGPEHPEVAKACEAYGHMLLDMGDYDAAKKMYERTLAIREKVLGREHQEYAIALQNLGRWHLDRGDRAEGRRLLEQALAIREHKLGPEHPGVAAALLRLGDAKRFAGDAPGANADYERALAIQEKVYGKDAPETIDALRNLAHAKRDLGQKREAKALYERALTNAERALGADHAYTAQLLDYLARIENDLGERREALATTLRAERAGREKFQHNARTLSERQALLYGEVRPSGLHLALSLAAHGLDTTGVRRVWDGLIASRALVLDEMAERRRTDRLAPDRVVDSLRAELEVASSIVSRAAMQTPEAADSPAARPDPDAARARLERIERALGERSAAFRPASGAAIGLAQVAAALPPRGALVAYARYHEPGANRDVTGDPPAYVALVLAGGARAPRAVPLGNATRIDALIERWRAHVGEAAGAGAGSATESAARAAGDSLRQLIWDPVARQLASPERVFIVPDGALQLVPFAALPTAAGHYLLEDGPLLHVLSTERDLVRSGSGARAGHGLLALGGVAFDSAAAPTTAAPLAFGGGSAPTATLAAFRGPSVPCPVFRDVRFGALPATADETNSIATIWREAPGASTATNDAVISLLGSDASESALKRLAPGRRVLHLATHGFFVDADCHLAPASSRGIGGLAAETPSDSAAPAPRTGGNPLRLSGLALAGANRRNTVARDTEDGILTAEEIAALDLNGVEWAVLSACDTGIGEIAASEGMFGLRRSLQVAGARTVICSLWKVDDASAARWMRSLYEHRLLGKEDTAQCVRAASQTELARRRATGESTHPFYWAGFVAAGDWR